MVNEYKKWFYFRSRSSAQQEKMSIRQVEREKEKVAEKLRNKNIKYLG